MVAATRDIEYDEGFSLTELLVVISLIGIILAAVYSSLQLTTRAAELQERNSWQANAITRPLHTFDVVLSQNTLIESGATGYRLSCFTDQDNDGVKERHVIEATTDGRLVETVHKVNSSGTNISLIRNTVWQANTTAPAARNANRSKSVPLFRYYHRDPNTGVVTEVTPANAHLANEVVVHVEAVYNGVEYRDSRQVMFRNR